MMDFNKHPRTIEDRTNPHIGYYVTQENDIIYLWKEEKGQTDKDTLVKSINVSKLGNGGTEEIIKELETVLKEKVSLPKINGNLNFGTTGQFAVSDGKGGVTWVNIGNAEEGEY